MSRIEAALAWRYNWIKYEVGTRYRRMRRRFYRVDGNDLDEAFAALGPIRSEILMVHSSLSGCGIIDGGESTVVGALRKWVGDGTLVMPTHSYCYPDANGEAPVYDRARSRSQVGAITEFFRGQSGVRRSNHPTHSIAAVGPLAAEISAGHEGCQTPCGSGTPYAKMTGRGASVLMFGARLEAYTFFHTAEDEAGVAYLYESAPYDLRATMDDGSIVTVQTWRQDNGVARRFAEMDGWLEARGLLVRRRLGCGDLLFVPDSRRVHEEIIAELRHDPLLLVAAASRRDLEVRLGIGKAVKRSA